MVRMFGTWEEAALFASYMRSEGYFASLLDECVAPLYGPAAVGGIRVLLSDSPVTDDTENPDKELHETESPPPAPPDGELIQIIRLATVSLAAFGLIVMGFYISLSVLHIPGGLVSILLLSLAFPALLGILFLSMIPAISPLTRSLRSSMEEGTAGWFFWLALFLLLFGVLNIH